MSYTPFNWQARTGQGLNKFTDQITGQVFEFNSTPDSIDNEGTPFSTIRMNALEQGLANVFDKPEQLAAAVAALYGLQNTAVPNDVFNILSGAALFRAGYTQNALNNWTETTNPTANRTPTKFAYNGVVAVACDFGDGSLWRSYDKGKTWEAFTITTGTQVWALVASGNAIYAINRMDPTIRYYTANGRDWNPYDSYSGLSGSILDAWIYNGTLCTIGADRQTILSIGSSYNATLPYQAATNGTPLIVDGTIYLLPLSGNQLMYSTDGKTWNTRTLPESISWGSMAYKDGVFVASCRTGSYNSYSSTDAINWTPGTARTAGNSVVLTSNSYFILPTAKLYSSDGQNWYPFSPNVYSTSAIYGAGFDDIIFTADYYSPQGFYWAAEKEIIPPQLTDVQGNQLVVNLGQVAAGSYIGSGTYGQDNPTQIPFPDFTPQMVVIATALRSVIWINSYDGGSYPGYFTFSDGVLSFYDTDNASDQFNVAGIRYYYFGIGGVSS